MAAEGKETKEARETRKARERGREEKRQTTDSVTAAAKAGNLSSPRLAGTCTGADLHLHSL